MTFSRAFPKKVAIGIAAIMLAGGLAIASPPHTAQGPITDAYVGTIQNLTFGADHSFLQGEINYAWNDGGCNDNMGGYCTGDPQPNGQGYSEYRIDDRTGSGTAERGVGIRYYLAKACDQQNITLPITANFNWDTTLDTTDRSVGTGSGSVATYLYAKNANDPATATGPYADGTNLTAVSSSNTKAISFSITGANQTYDTTIGIATTAAVTDLPPPSHEYAHPHGTVTLKSVDVSFGDSSPPQSTPTLSPPTANLGGTGQFKGYFKTFPTLSVHSFDPIVSGQTTIPHSCVDHIALGAGLADLPVDYYQNDVSKRLDQNRKYDLDVQAVDKNKNTETSHKISLVVDVELPVTTANVWPPSPTGNNGWYKGPALSVQFNATCDDTNGHTVSTEYSGCTQSNYTLSPGPSGFRNPGDKVKYIVTLPASAQGSSVTFTASSEDRATNQGNATTPPAIKVDFNPPGIGFNKTANAIFSNDWFNVPVTYTFDCDARAEISGCFALRTKLNGGAFGSANQYNFATEGQNTVLAQVEDNAGNQNNLSKDAKLDFTVPGGVPNAILTTAHNTVDGTDYVRQVPWFSWGAASDALSGVRGYVADVDGTPVTAFSNRTAMAPVGTSAGMHTFHVSAVDNAGNVGSASEVQFFFDFLGPTMSITSLTPGRIYLSDGTTMDSSAPGTPTSYAPIVVLRDMYVNVSGNDGNASVGSGMFSTSLTDGGVAISCTTSTASTCSHYYDRAEGFSNGEGHNTFVGHGVDNAGNAGATLIQPVARVDIGLLNGNVPNISPPAGQSTSTGVVFWKQYTGTDFVAYEIHRSTAAGFTPIEPNDPLGQQTTLVASFTDQTIDQWTDLAPLIAGAQGVYHYELVVTHGTGSLLHAYSHQTTMDYATSYLSVADPCAAGALQCIG